MTTRGWKPGKLIEISGYFRKTGTLHAAVKPGVFSVIGNRQLTGGEIAQRLNGAYRGVQKLLDTLPAMALLDKSDNLHANTPSGKNLIAKDAAITSARSGLSSHFRHNNRYQPFSRPTAKYVLIFSELNLLKDIMRT